MPRELDLDKYPADAVAAAFWLQEKIRRDGIEGIHFMRDAETWAEEVGDTVVAAHVTVELNKL